MSKRIKEIIVRYDDKQSFIYGNTLGEVVGELVRCKECKHASDNNVYGCMCNHFNDNAWDYHRMYADDFCSRGERKESE